MFGILIRLAAAACLFQLPLVRVIPVFVYFDEVLAFFLAAAFVLRTVKDKAIIKTDLCVILLLAALIPYGLICNAMSGVLRPSVAIVQDALTVLKVFACYFGAKYLFEGHEDNDKHLRWTATIVKAATFVAFVGLPLAYAGVVPWLSNTVRLGFRCYEFIYGSPGMLSQYCVLYMVVLLADLTLPGSRKTKWLFIFMLLVVWASSMRTRAFVMIFLVLFFYHIVFSPTFQKNASNRSILRRIASPMFLIPCAIFVLIIAQDQIDLYYGEMTTARSYLLDGGIRIFKDYFPFGSGFATYGTEAAGSYYSPLYFEYGVNAHWALGVDGSELTDTFWPAILAEFGAIGLVMYTIPLGMMFFQIVRGCSSDRYLLISAFSFVSYTLIASTATGVFFSYTISDCMLFVGLMLGLAQQRRKSVYLAER